MTAKTLIPLGLALLVFEARSADKFALTVDNIMRGPALVGYEPTQIRWSHDSRRIFFQWKQASDKPAAPLDTYVVERDGSPPRKLSDAEARQAPPAYGDVSRDRRLTVFSRDGDLFLYDSTNGQVRQVTDTAEPETDPHFLPDGKRISFTRGGNLYVMSLDTGFLEQMTDIRAAGAPQPAAPPAGFAGGFGGRGGRGGAAPPEASAEPKPAGASQEALKKEQKELFETVRDRAALHDEAEARRMQEHPRKPFTLESRQSVAALQLSPDEKYAIAIVMEARGARSTTIPRWITDSAYVEDSNGRPDVGDAQARPRLAVIDALSGELKWVDHGQKAEPAAAAAAPTTPAPDAPQKEPAGAAAVRQAHGPRTAEPPEREVNLALPVWSEDGSKAALLGRSVDNKDRWVFALDPATARLRVLAHDHDDAWIDGPGVFTLGWMKNDREVYFQSERTGYSHLYAVSWDGGEPRALTSGKWEVLAARQSPDKSQFYITANMDTPYENHLYEMSGEGGPLTRLTSRPGRHVTTVSPDQRWIADVYSYTNQPPELYVEENRPGAESRRLTVSPAPDFAAYPWLDVPIVTFTARDGVEVPARLFKPAHFRKGGPGVVFVHGAGYLQNVDRWWSTAYYREYLFDHLLMERGFIVIDVDYRGSAGYGRDWRTAIYQHMGGKDLDDITDAAKYLVAKHGASPARIGLWGGSYGGFLTLMAMFTRGDTFAAGAALRPVSDWALYNQGYTSNILNLPQTDEQAYRRSSPIYFADGLKGALLICHGMVDSNVEFDDTVRLVQRLIELRKENWQLAVYPVENHAFTEASSWADEYKRILALFERTLGGG
ncbi:MAG TPA: alpha/beta fold hydrolase [Candidatus Acidoferrales bacterium]|nr:alpha/beta fold hydrolase [Candidatus Acidoferrales bacterium]